MNAEVSRTPEPSAPQLIRLLLPIAVAAALLGIAFALTSPFLAVFLSRNLHADPVRSAGFLFLTPLSAVVVSTLLAPWSDRPGARRRMLAVIAAAGAAGNLCFALMTSYWGLLVISLTLVAVGGSLDAQIFAYARQLLDREAPAKATMMINNLRMVMSVSWVVGPPVATVLLARTGFTGLYATAAGCLTVAGGIAVGWLEEPGGDRSGPGVMRELGPAEPAAAPVWLTAVAFTCMQCASSVGVLALPLFVDGEVHADVQTAGVILGLCAALEIPLMVGFGALSGRVPLQRLIVLGAVAGAGYYGLVAASTAVWQVAAAQLINACFISSVLGLGISYVQNLLPESPGRATTIFSNTGRVAPLLAGPVIGAAQQFGYRVAYVACSLLCVLGLVLLEGGRRRLRRTAPVTPPGEPATRTLQGS